MKDNYEYSEYKDTKTMIPWKRIMLILLMLIVVVVIALFVLKGCGKSSLSKTLVEAGKEYYTTEALPTNAGECYTVTLETLENKDLIKKTDAYSTCDNSQTYVKVCYLESKTYQYTPVLSCTVETTKFGEWADGSETNLIPDVTDVRFSFLGQELSSGTKYYYPSDATDMTKVSEYYATSPSAGYTGKGDGANGYKWYTESTGTSYWNNGGYSSTQPSGYTTKGASTTTTTYTDVQPAAADYRTIASNVQIYRTRTLARPYRYACTDPNGILPGIMIGDTICANRTDGYTKFYNMYYTCDGTKEVAQSTVCSDYTAWTNNACTTSVKTGLECTNKTGYSYTDISWKWSKTYNVIKYYPSNSSTAAGEKTYYITAPIAGAIKDVNSSATVNKYYKIVKDTNASSTTGEWMGVTDGYVTEDALITKFKELGYEVTSLSDINSLSNIRYQLQLQYRNVEE